MTDRIASEEAHEEVYGATFALYSAEDLEDFVTPFETRLSENGIDPVGLFSDKRVLDAGCGGGRGSLLAVRNGASHVDAVDISSTNTQTTARVLELSGGSFDVHLSSLADLAFEDDFFDVVWCNGVLMHTAKPSQTLTEIIRVLKPGGRAWIYVYGCEGVYWRTISVFRRVFAEVTVTDLIKGMQHEGLPTDRIAEMVDDWKAPFLRTYAQAEWEIALSELGCEYTRLLRGMPYDTSEQLARGSSPDIVGQGDLRYMLVKQQGFGRVLSDDSRTALDGSHLDEFEFQPFSSAPVDSDFLQAAKDFEKRSVWDPIAAIPFAVRVQLYLRDTFLRSPDWTSVQHLAFLLSVDDAS